MLAPTLQGQLGRGQILAGAADVFTRKGADDATVEDILRASRISRRTFYRFFRDKQDVLAALHEVATGMFVQGMRAATAAGGKPVARMERVIDALLGFTTSSGRLMQVLHGEAHRPGSRLMPRRRQVVDELVGLFAAEARAAVGGEVDDLVLRGLLLALEGIAHAIISDPTPPDARRLAQARRAMLRIATATIEGGGSHVAPLPMAR